MKFQNPFLSNAAPPQPLVPKYSREKVSASSRYRLFLFCLVLRGCCQLCTNSLGEFTNTFVLFAGRCQTYPKGISVEGKHNNFVHILYFILSMCKPRWAMSGSSLKRSETPQCLISVLIRFINIIFDLLEINFERLLKCQLSAFN